MNHNEQSNIANYSKAISLSPFLLDTEWYSNMSLKDSIKAHTVLENAKLDLSKQVAIDPHPFLKIKLAKVLFYCKDMTLTEKSLREVANNMPNLNRLWLTLGNINDNIDDSLAIIYYKKSAFLGSYDPLPPYYISQIYKRINRLEEADSYTQTANTNLMYHLCLYSRMSYRVYGAQAYQNPYFPCNLIPTLSIRFPEYQLPEN